MQGLHIDAEKKVDVDFGENDMQFGGTGGFDDIDMFKKQRNVISGKNTRDRRPQRAFQKLIIW